MPTGITSDEVIVLNKKFKVTRKGFNYYKELAGIAIRNLEHGKKYQLKQIFGSDCWECFGNGERRLIGMCVARMVRDKDLPLSLIVKKSKYPLQYRLN